MTVRDAGEFGPDGLLERRADRGERKGEITALAGVPVGQLCGGFPEQRVLVITLPGESGSIEIVLPNEPDSVQSTLGTGQDHGVERC
jgi:hypothetical protein